MVHKDMKKAAALRFNISVAATIHLLIEISWRPDG